MKRKTISENLIITGIGLHKGEQISIDLKPLNENKGIIFKRVDMLNIDNEIKVDIGNLFNLERGTNIKNIDGAEVYTIEHIMSAFYVLGITDIMIEISGNELPILDGSSGEFINLIESVGLTELNKEIEPIIIKNPVYISDNEKNRYVIALPYDGYKISYTIDFNHEFLKSQYYEIEVNLETYKNEISNARTFVFDYEIDFLKKNNLALGGSLENAVVMSQSGVINSEGFRLDLEPVKHKILDLIGDLYVGGQPIKGHIIAIKSGHYLNSKLLEKILKEYKN